MIEPEHAEKKSHVADARGDERFLCGGRGARSLDPEPNQQIGSEPDEFPANEKKKQTVRDDYAEHCAGEKREISEEAGEIFVVGHVANAEDKNTEPNECDHHEHHGGERIEHPSNAQRLVAESEPREILNAAKAGRLQRLAKGDDRQGERNDLAEDCQCGRAFAARFRQTQNSSETASGIAGISQS